MFMTRSVVEMTSMKTSEILKLLMRPTTNLFSSLAVERHDMMHECMNARTARTQQVQKRNFPK